MRRRLLAGLAATAAVATSLLISSAGPATAADTANTPPAAAPSTAVQSAGSTTNGTRDAIKIPEPGYKIVATLRGIGKQVYTCTNGVYVLREPVAVLSSPRGGPVAIHGKGPFWAHFDGSRVDASKIGEAPSPAGASNVAWLLLKATPTPDTGGTFGNVGYIQRIDTKGGVAPAKCAASTVAVDYSADYVFWAK
jgi:hypothetical protein